MENGDLLNQASNLQAETDGHIRPRPATYIMLLFLVLAWPGLNLLLLLPGEYEIDFDQLNPVLFVFLPTIVIQWLIFLAVLLVLRREKAPLSSIGLVRPRRLDFLRAVAFVIVSNVVLLVLQLLLTVLGLPVSRDVDQIVEKGREYSGWWLGISITAAICEETAFRGFVITRFQAVTRGGFFTPVLLSTVAFAAGHVYQGWGGFILIFIYGMMFCGLYLYYRSLWPGIIAHFIQDFSAIFVYRWFDS